MKFRSALVLLCLFVAAAIASGQTFSEKRTADRAARTAEIRDRDRQRAEKREADVGQQVVRTIATTANVAVKVCVTSGSITVHGWERNEVRARSTDVAEIEFQHDGEPANKLQLLIADKAQGTGRTTSCLSFSDVEMNVPRGATVQLQTRDGDIKVADVSTAYVSTQSGDVTIERVSKAVDAATMGGVISLKDSSGGFNLHSVGGNIEASGVRPSEASDVFDARSLGGDIVLDQVAHARLNARSLNGSLSMTGRLAHDGHYDFNTISGDVTLVLPADSSFKISARLSQKAEVITDFPITLKSYSSAPANGPEKVAPLPGPDAVMAPGPAPSPQPPWPDASSLAAAVSPVDPPAETQKGAAKMKGVKVPRVVVVGYPLRRLDGVCGTGDSMIDIGSFSGTVHIKKQ